MLSHLVLATTLTIGLSASFDALAQNQRRGQPAMPQATDPVEIQGAVEEVVRGGIVVLSDLNEPWQVFMPPNTKVQVTGAASADHLKNGLFVEFDGEIDAEGKLTGKIDHLTIVTLSPERQVGFSSPNSGVGGEDLGGFDMEGGLGGKPAKPRKKVTKSGVAPGPYRIVGKLTVARGGKMLVQAGRGALSLELTEQPTIALDVNDYSVASKGDKIHVKGLMMPNVHGRAQATEVKIELAEPLASPTKKKPVKPDARKAPKRPKKGDDEGLAEPLDDQ